MGSLSVGLSQQTCLWLDEGSLQTPGKKSRAGIGSVARTRYPAPSPSLGHGFLESQPASLYFLLLPCLTSGSPTKSRTSEMVGEVAMGIMTWPLPSVFRSKSWILEADPEDNVAETLTGTPEAGEPDMSRTRA